MWSLTRTHASGRWLGTKQAGVCAVGYMSSPKGEAFREECEPTLPQGSPKGDMSWSEGGSARRRKKSAIPPCSPWLCESDNAEGKKAPDGAGPSKGCAYVSFLLILR